MAQTEHTSIFSFGRTVPFPTIYPELEDRSVTYDVLEMGWVAAFLTLYLCFMIIVPAASTGKKRLYFTIRMTIILLVGFMIMWCNFGQEWEVGEIEARMFYKAGSTQEIDARVGLKLGLRSVNITLRAVRPPEGDLSGETINYNERFYWTWQQGRAGFGRFAGQIQRDFREAQFRGLPYPILWAAEYFTFDAEGFRFGRHYRLAGWYAHICIWSALPIWVLTIITSHFVISYCANLLVLLGLLLVIPSIIWACVRNFNELAIIYDDTSMGILRTHFGLHWYLSLFTGIFCICSGFLLYILGKWYYNELCIFFDIDPLGVLELDQGLEDEIEDDSGRIKSDPDSIEMTERSAAPPIPKKSSKITLRLRPKGTVKWRQATPIDDADVPPPLPAHQFLDADVPPPLPAHQFLDADVPPPPPAHQVDWGQVEGQPGATRPKRKPRHPRPAAPDPGYYNQTHLHGKPDHEVDYTDLYGKPDHEVDYTDLHGKPDHEVDYTDLRQDAAESAADGGYMDMTAHGAGADEEASFYSDIAVPGRRR